MSQDIWTISPPNLDGLSVAVQGLIPNTTEHSAELRVRRLVGWLVDLVGRLVGRLVGGLIGWLVGWLVSRLVG